MSHAITVKFFIKTSIYLKSVFGKDILVWNIMFLGYFVCCAPEF